MKYQDKEFESKLHDFYNSREWKDIKQGVYFRLKNQCPVCGSRDKLVIDHIQPVRYFWEERLNPANLQILCNDCNLEKGSMLDWTLEWHLQNKDRLQREQLELKRWKEEKKQRESLKEEFRTISEEEQDHIKRAWSSYLSKMGHSSCRVSKRDFIVYLKRNLMDLSQAKQFVRRNYLHICPMIEEPVSKAVKNEKTIRVVKKNGDIKEYKTPIDTVGIEKFLK